MLAYCCADWCGRYTPACDHAHDVRPEQSKATPGLAAANLYATPCWLSAAATAVPARDEAAGIGAGAGATAGRGVCGAAPPPPPPPPPPVAGLAPPLPPPPTDGALRGLGVAACCCASAAARACASARAWAAAASACIRRYD